MSSSVGIFASQISGHLFTLQGSYDALASVTVPSGGVSSVTFAGIPTGYSHLQIRSLSLNSSTSNIWMRANSDTSANYASHWLQGDGSGASAGSYVSQSDGIFYGYNTTAQPMASVCDILDYATNKYKTVRSLQGNDTNGSGNIFFRSNLWTSTSAINALTIYCQSGSFAQYSSFALYGVK
jgi:hypothetical protein